ncbi:MAG: hypothetical protein DRR42_19730, partial [Gammaproteobacteria bacterium]
MNSDTFKKIQHCKRLINDGKYDTAISILVSLNEQENKVLEIDELLAESYFYRKDYTLSLLHYKRTMEEHGKHNADNYFNLAVVYEKVGDYLNAIKFHEKVLELDAGYIRSLRLLPIFYLHHGNKQKAVSVAKRALLVDPNDYKAYFFITRAAKYTQDDKLTLEMAKLFEQKSVPSEGKMYLGFSLAKVYEENGDYELAFNALSIANKIKRATLNYDRNPFLKRQFTLKQLLTPDYIKQYQDKGYRDKTPIFIVGMPRSGTSLVEQILASHPDVFGAGELIEFLNAEKKYLKNIDDNRYYNLGKDYIEQIRKYDAETVHIVDKRPANFTEIAFILLSLPDAKIIHCQRDPMDNCFSLFKTLFDEGLPMCYDLSEVGESYRVYQDIMADWHKLFPNRIYDLKYENLVTDNENEVKKLLKYCELDWNDSCLNFYKTDRAVKTPSSMQVKKPLYKDSIHMWKNYEQYLDPLKLALKGETMMTEQQGKLNFNGQEYNIAELSDEAKVQLQNLQAAESEI